MAVQGSFQEINLFNN